MIALLFVNKLNDKNTKKSNNSAGMETNIVKKYNCLNVSKAFCKLICVFNVIK